MTIVDAEICRPQQLANSQGDFAAAIIPAVLAFWGNNFGDSNFLIKTSFDHILVECYNHLYPDANQSWSSNHDPFEINIFAYPFGGMLVSDLGSSSEINFTETNQNKRLEGITHVAYSFNFQILQDLAIPGAVLQDDPSGYWLKGVSTTSFHGNPSEPDWWGFFFDRTNLEVQYEQHADGTPPGNPPYLIDDDYTFRASDLQTAVEALFGIGEAANTQIISASFLIAQDQILNSSEHNPSTSIFWFSHYGLRHPY